MNSVVSAAIIEGSLIIGLSDGSIINCGFVQGPQGLSGPQGPMGATGDNGTDGNTIITVGGTPGNEMGSDGDYAIDNINWRIYGPKSGGVWGKAKSMLPDAESMITNGRMPGTGSGGGSMGGSGSGSGGGTVYTNTVQLTAVTRAELINKTGYRVLPLPGAGKTNQEDANRWAFGDVFDRIDETIPVKIASGTPTAEYVGQLYFDTTSSTLFLWDGTLWNPIGGGSNSVGGGISAGDTVNGLWSFTTNTVQPGEWRFIDGSNAYDGGIQIEISDTDSQSDSYPIEYFKIGSQLQLRNVDQTGEFLNTGELNGVLTAVTLDSPDTYRLTYTVEGATGTAINFARVRVAIAITIEDLDDRYVNSTGDTMIGNLVMDDANILVEDGSLIFNRTGTDVELQDEENRFSTIKSVAPYDIDTGTLDYSTKFGIKIDLDGGNSFKNNFKVGNRHGDIVRITSGEGAQIEFATSGFTPNAQNTGLTSGIAIRHIPTPSFENSPGDLAVNKEYVDARDEILQQEIIELEEEIDAIAPSVERGKWRFTAVGTVGQPGQFTMYDDDFGNGSPTGLFKSAKSIWFNEIDSDGTPHAFADVDDGELLEIFIDGSPEFGLYEVVGKAHDETDGASSFWVVDVNFVRTNEATTAVGPGELCRFKIFMAPTGGDASGFVLKIGDTMTGDLVIDTSEKSDDNEAALILKGNRPSTTNSAATIKFDNEQSTEKGYLTYRSFGTSSYFKFNQDVALNNNGLHSVGQIRMEPGGYIGSGNKERIKVRDGTGTQAGTEIQRVGDNKRTFAIRGKPAGSSTNVGDIFHAYGGPTSDGIYYTGIMDEPTNIVTKEYVDDKIVSASGELYTLTTCGNHYTYSNGLDAPDFTNFRTASGSMEYNTEFHFKQLWTHENYGGLLKGNWEPTPSTMFELYIRAKLILKTPIKDWKTSTRSGNCIMFSPAGPQPMTHEHTSFFHNSTYEVVLTNMRKI